MKLVLVVQYSLRITQTLTITAVKPVLDTTTWCIFEPIGTGFICSVWAIKTQSCRNKHRVDLRQLVVLSSSVTSCLASAEKIQFSCIILFLRTVTIILPVSSGMLSYLVRDIMVSLRRGSKWFWWFLTVNLPVYSHGFFSIKSFQSRFLISHLRSRERESKSCRKMSGSI